METALGEAGIRVLIADDVAEFRTLLRVTLVLDGRFELAGEAGDGAETVELAAAQQPDVILLDLSMPVMDGFEVIPELRRRAPDSKIVVLSGFMASRLGVDVLERGAHAYVEKGADAEELVATLIDLCRPVGSPAPRSSEPPRLTGLDLWRAADADVLGPPREVSPAAPPPPTARPDVPASGPPELELRRRLAGPVAAMRGLVATLQGGVDRLPPSLVVDCVEELAVQLAALDAAVRPVDPDPAGTTAPAVPGRAAEDLSTLIREVVAEVAARNPTGPPTVVALAPVMASVDAEHVRMILRGLLDHAGAADGAGAGTTISLDRIEGSVEIAVAGPAPSYDGRASGPAPGATGPPGVPLDELQAAARAHGGDLLSVPRTTGVQFLLRLPAP